MIIKLGYAPVELLAEGGIWLPETRTLCVADLHFEKDSFFAKQGVFLPPYGSLETYQKLEKLVEAKSPQCVIAAGDSFHDKAGASRLSPEIGASLNKLIKRWPHWHWLLGNHDPDFSENIYGTRSEEIVVEGITFRHQTLGIQGSEVSGHYHPKSKQNILGHSFSLRCFVKNQNRLILPAFGQYTGGLDVESDVMKAVAPPVTRQIFVIHADRVFAA